MLRIYNELQKINFGKLMEVYTQSNLENATELYPEEQSNLAVLCVEQDFLTYLREVFFQTKGAFYAVWEEDGAYISALRMEPYRNGLLLEALETAPQYRQRGYATLLLRSVLKHLRLQDVHKIYSHVNKRNWASLRTHAACGFQRVQEYASYIDGSLRRDSCTLCYCIPGEE